MATPAPPLDQQAMSGAVSSSRITTRGWSLNGLIESSDNFYRMDRIHYSAPSLKASMSQHEASGTPLIIFGWNRHPHWPKSLFNVEWLRRNGDQNPTVRNVHDWSDFQIPLSDFIEKMRTSSPHTTAQEQERLYGKDGDCPAEWTKWLTDGGVIPDEVLFHGSNDFLKYLPESAKVQTLMCYMGIGDTFTPFHKDLCASSGQNLMCYSENGGSSFWFMTKASDAPDVVSYFHGLGHEVDLEAHVVTLEELRSAPFDVYIAEQRLGDLVLVPPRSCHQVVNSGGITIKTSWSRMSLDGLRVAVHHELPIYHRVCRREIYKVKSIIYHAMEHYTRVVEQTESEIELVTPARKLQQLLRLFDDVLVQEYTSQHASLAHISNTSDLESIPFDPIECDFCGADIFQSFFECGKCLSPSSSSEESHIVLLGDGLVLCPSCYVEGRTCQCGEMQPVQCRVMGDLLQNRDRAVKAIRRFESHAEQEFGYLSERPNRLLENDSGVFESAYKLHLRRQSAPRTKSCRFAHGSERSHPMPAPAVVSCKPCHSSRCFTHLLEKNSLHSVEVITVSDRYGNDTRWHQHHQASNEIYLSSGPTILEDEQLGKRPNMLLRLAHLAKTYTTCKPITPDLTKPGWYDHYVYVTVVPISPSKAEAVSDFPDDISGDRDNPNQASTPYSDVDGTADMDCDTTDQDAETEMSMILDHPTELTINHTEHNSPGGLSALTDLPSEIDSIFDGTSQTICNPLIAANSTAPNNPTEREESKQKMVLDFVEVPRPEWYRKMRGEGIAAPRLSRPLNTPESDDVPIHQLARSVPNLGPKGSRKADVNNCSPATLVATAHKGSAEHTLTPKRGARKQPKSQSSTAVKRRRVMESCPGTSEDSELAFALNSTFERNSSKYVDKGVQAKLKFTKLAVPTENTPNALERQAEITKSWEDKFGAAQEEIQRLTARADNLEAVNEMYRRGSFIPPAQSSSDSQASPPECAPSLFTRMNRPRRPTPTEPRSDRLRRMNNAPSDCNTRWNYSYPRNSPVKYKPPRGRGFRRGGNRPKFPARAHTCTLPSDFCNDLMTNPVLPGASSATSSSHSPTGSSGQSQSSTSTVMVQDCFEEHGLASKLDVITTPKQPKLEDAECGGAASEDEVSLGDDDDVQQAV